MNCYRDILVSIITPSFNHGAFIDKTIRSVLDQNYPHIEHIVIDGGSSDNTVSVLKKYSHLKWKSEKDHGQADALNKGLALATGDIIGWINSDDFYERGTFVQVAQYFKDPEIMWVIGNVSYQLELTGEVIPNRSQAITYQNLLRNPDTVRQQAAFFRRSFIERAGGWDPYYFMAMDLDLWVRLAKISPPRMVDVKWANFRIHEFQKTSHANVKRQTAEIIRILRREHASWRLVCTVYIKKHWFFIKAYVKELLIRIGVIDLKYRHRTIRLKKGK